MVATPCPCGTRRKPGTDDVAYITNTILQDAAGASGAVLALIDGLYAKAINVDALCSQPPPAPVTPEVDWFTDPFSFEHSLLTNVLRISWNQWCQCTPCPPTTGCLVGTPVSLDSGDGACHDVETIGGVDVCVQTQYVMYGGVDVYVSRDSDGVCFGPFNGLVVDWVINSTFDPSLTVSLDSYGGGAHTGWAGATYGSAMTAWVGGGTGGGGPVWSWPLDGPTTEDPPGAPTCDPTDICTATDDIRTTINTMQTQLGWLSWALFGTTGDGTFPLPGTITDANGTLMDVIRQAVTALAPVTPTQLVNSDTTPVSASGSVDVTGKAFVEIAFTAVGTAYGSRGTDAVIYFSNFRYPGPGWVLLCSDYGVIEYRELVYPAGLQLVLPPTATHLLFEIQPDVTLNVTTFERSVS